MKIRKHPDRNEGALSIREIAERLGVSHGTVLNIEQRALKKLRKLLEEMRERGETSL